ncbi:MAG: multiheme c-type cytochrome [Campylobacterota bacterium]|nr:multiheme c-type cytochrome [Campylobacterota bacterium]
MKILILISMLFSLQYAKYYDSKSCGECHEDIYREHTKSMHHKSSILKDEIHRKVAEKVTPGKYSCALCHMPSTNDLAGMIRGKHQPKESDVRHQDGVSCSYCHQINNIYHAKAYNINFTSNVKGQKPTYYGNLENPDDSDKHSAGKHPFYKNSEVCMGCHSHKENKHGVQVCNTLNQYEKTSDCIGCHMPKYPGPVEKFNKKGRDEYASHEFLGIHSTKMVKKAVNLLLQQTENGIALTISNRMGHRIITQPMRLKFAKTVITRKGKVIWSNFKDSPLEDKEATFVIVFKDENGKASLPGSARGYKINQNLEAVANKTVHYVIDDLRKGDEVTSTWISYIIKPKLAKKLQITDKDTIKPYIGAEEAIVIQ